jgi:hypothetical protein
MPKTKPEMSGEPNYNLAGNVSSPSVLKDGE